MSLMAAIVEAAEALEPEIQELVVDLVRSLAGSKSQAAATRAAQEHLQQRAIDLALAVPK